MAHTLIVLWVQRVRCGRERCNGLHAGYIRSDAGYIRSDGVYIRSDAGYKWSDAGYRMSDAGYLGQMQGTASHM